MDKKQTIQLTEQDIHMLVEDAVKIYLKENQTDELFNGLRALGSGIGQRVKNTYNNAKNLYQAGSMNANVQKAVGNVMKALTNLQNVSKGIDPNLEELCVRIEQELQQGVQQTAQTNLQNARNQFVNGRQQQPQFTVQSGDGNGGFNQYR